MITSHALPRWGAATVAALAIVMAIAGDARAAKKAAYEVRVTPAGAPAWQVTALEAALRQDLADDRLRAVTPPNPPELVIRAELAPGELRYAIERSGAAPSRGVIELGALDRRALAGELRDVLHRVVRPAHEGVSPGPPVDLPPVGGLGLALVLLGVFAALVLSPVIAATWLARGARLRVRVRAIAAALGVGAVAAVLVLEGHRVPEVPGAILFAGGLAWGVLAAAVMPHVMPPIAGFHRVEHHELIPALRVWALLVLQRAVAAALALGALGGLLWLLGELLGVPPVVTFGVIAPLCVLGLRLAVRGFVELAAARLDGELVDGDAGPDQPWHAQVRGYLVGYLRRANLDADEAALDRLRFLPGREPDVVAVYGGGLTHTRVVLGRAMLEHALAPYGRPHDYLAPRVSTLHWTHWNAGLVMPTEPGAKTATREDRQVHHTVDEGDAERIALGEPPTLSGIVEPIAFDPRDRYRPGDDPLWLDWDPGEEHDGTDAGDKDYLFGFLVHALGMVHRHDDRAATLALAWRRWLAPRKVGRALDRVVRPVAAFAARQRDGLGDVAVVLGGARHHLAQSLGWTLWRRDDLVTARAYVPQLEQQSRELARTLRTSKGGEEDDPAARRRLARLVRYVAPSTVVAGRPRRWAVGLGLAAGAAAVVALVVQAVVYHGTYEERIEAEARRVKERTSNDGEGN